MNSELPRPQEPAEARPVEPTDTGETSEVAPTGPASPELPTEPAVERPPPPPTVGVTANHRFALPSLIMGVLSMLGILSCICPMFWLPFLQLCPSLWALALGGGALYTGNQARREIEASGGSIGGRDQADAGFIMGIIGVAFGLLAVCLGVLYAVALIALPEGPFRTR